jgi:hypothetical protein
MILLLLDIDRTLVHSVPNYNVNSEWYNHFDSLKYENFTIFIRPHLTTFLDTLFKKQKQNNNKYFQIGIFTAGSWHYMNYITEKIFKDYPLNRNYLFHEYHSDQSLLFDNKLKSLDYIKSFLVLNKQLNPEDDIYLIDDSVSVKNKIGENCYLIPKFYVCTDDIQPVFNKKALEDTSLLECLKWIDTI